MLQGSIAAIFLVKPKTFSMHIHGAMLQAETMLYFSRNVGYTLCSDGDIA